MKNQDMPAMPVSKNQMNVGSISGGLTKLEHFAGLAMQGLLASTDGQIATASADDIADMAVHTAKALLAELEKENV